MTQLYNDEQIRDAVTTDPFCHALYRAVFSVMETHKLTPGEVRAIVVVAATDFEAQRLGTRTILPPVDSRGSNGPDNSGS